MNKIGSPSWLNKRILFTNELMRPIQKISDLALMCIYVLYNILLYNELRTSAAFKFLIISSFCILDLVIQY